MRFTTKRISLHEWSSALARADGASYFHTPTWLTLVASHFGTESELHRVTSPGGAEYLCPVFVGALAGERGFTIGAVGYGGPLPLARGCDELFGPAALPAIVATLAEATGLECRRLTAYPDERWSRAFPAHVRMTHMLHEVDRGEAALWARVGKGVRYSLKRAARAGVRVGPAEPGEAEGCYELLVATQKRVGAAYTTPRAFFLELCARALAGGEIRVLVARHDGRPVSMGVFLQFRDDVFHLFHGWSEACADVGANQALLWDAIRTTPGATTFNLGESHSPSLQAYKARWGAVPTPVLKLNFQGN